MDRDTLIDELLDNVKLIKTARFKLEDINLILPIESSEYIEDNLIDAQGSLELVQKLYEKEIEKLGGNI